MTNPKIFDHYAAGYDRTVDRAIAASGESVSYFAELKASLTCREFNPASIRTILDFGCGVGNTTKALSAQFPTARIVGLDASSESVTTAADRFTQSNGRVSFVVESGATLPFDNESFDLVFASCVLHHIEPGERATWARELYRVCANRGSIVVFEHNPFNPLTQRVVRDCPFDEGVVLLRPGYAKELLRSAGFQPQSPQFYFFFPHALRVLRSLEFVLRRVPIGAQYYLIGTRGGL